MRAFRASIAVVWLSAAGIPTAFAQDLPQWTLGDPGFRTDGGSVPLYRVTAARHLADGAIVIADAGNNRVAIFDRSARLVLTLGRQGDGPGEFRSPSHLFVFGDTIAVYDQLSLRFTVWESVDEEPRTWRHLSYGDAPPNVEGAFSSMDYLLTSIHRTPRNARGLFVDEADLLRHRLSESEGQVLTTGPQRYLYLFGEDTGNTTYRTPFFGATTHAIAAGAIVTVPLHSARMRFLDPVDGEETGALQLPIEEREFDHREIARYRDALVERAGDGATANRIRSAFDEIEPPPTGPVVRRLVPIGNLVWAERFPKYGDTEITWVIVDPAHRRLLATIRLPATSRPLSGRDGSVLLLERDELDLETVVERPVIRR